MATILDTLKKGTVYLQKHGVDEARLGMELLIAHVLVVDRMQLYIDFDKDIPEKHLNTLRDLTKRRSRGEPLQHLLGTVEFCGHEFRSDARALIPRPETEELTMHLLPQEWPSPPAILDMGCGSGVIGLSLASHLANGGATVTLADISGEALALARENAESLLGAASSVRFVKSELFADIAGSFDLIVANLPYVPDTDETKLSREVRHDPALALYGGPRGTEIMERFLRESPPYLNPGGRIAMEFGAGQAGALRALAEELGFYLIEIRRDLAGMERFLFATKSA